MYALLLDVTKVIGCSILEGCEQKGNFIVVSEDIYAYVLGKLKEHMVEFYVEDGTLTQVPNVPLLNEFVLKDIREKVAEYLTAIVEEPYIVYSNDSKLGDNLKLVLNQDTVTRLLTAMSLKKAATVEVTSFDSKMPYSLPISSVESVVTVLYARLDKQLRYKLMFDNMLADDINLAIESVKRFGIEIGGVYADSRRKKVICSLL